MEKNSENACIYSMVFWNIAYIHFSWLRILAFGITMWHEKGVSTLFHFTIVSENVNFSDVFI